MPRTPKYLWNHVNLYDTYEQNHTLSRNEFRMILKTFSNLWLQSMVEEGKVYNMPFNLGYLGVFTFPNSKSFDYQHFKDTGEKQWHANLHTGSLSAQMRHRKSKLAKPTSNVYKFRLARDPARNLAKLINNNNYITKYFQYETYFN